MTEKPEICTHVAMYCPRCKQADTWWILPPRAGSILRCRKCGYDTALWRVVDKPGMQHELPEPKPTNLSDKEIRDRISDLAQRHTTLRDDVVNLAADHAKVEDRIKRLEGQDEMLRQSLEATEEWVAGQLKSQRETFAQFPFRVGEDTGAILKAVNQLTGEFAQLKSRVNRLETRMGERSKDVAGQAIELAKVKNAMKIRRGVFDEFADRVNRDLEMLVRDVAQLDQTRVKKDTYDTKLKGLFGRFATVEEAISDLFEEQQRLKRIEAQPAKPPYAGRSHTPEEAVTMLLGHLRHLARYWGRCLINSEAKACMARRSITEGEYRTEGAIYSALKAIDGSSDNLPAFLLFPDPTPEEQQEAQESGENWWDDSTPINEHVALHEMFDKLRNES